MDPITLKALATLMQLHGAGATLVSDNKGVDELLGTVRTQLESETPPVQLAMYARSYAKTRSGGYGRSHAKSVFLKSYQQAINRRQPTGGPGGITHGGGPNTHKR